MTTPITLTKKYRLRGFPRAEVEVLKTDMGGEWAVLFRHKNPADGIWQTGFAHADGSVARWSHNHDLIEVPARVRIEGFVNVYRGQDGNHAVHWFPTKAEAMEARRFGAPIACIPISLDLEEGEGL